MKLMKRYFLITIIIFIVLFSSGCSNSNKFSKKSDELKTEIQTIEGADNTSKENEKIVWDEINKQGEVNEDLLVKNIDQKILTYVAQQLQSICKEISAKGEKDKNYWLTGQWYTDIVDSKQYKNVIALNKKAMKPLFLIIYKSPNAGMYEWACSKALDEISGFDFSGKDNDNAWSNSKEFLKKFIDIIIEQKIKTN